MQCVLSGRDGSRLVNVHSGVEENDHSHRESCWATWLDLVMETRPQRLTTVFENNTLRRESYTQKQIAHVLVQRSPLQTIRMGLRGREMKEYQLPYRNILPVPIFTPGRIGSRTEAQLGTFSPQEPNGVCENRRDVAEITKDMPKVIQPNFRSSYIMGEVPESPQRG